MSEARLLSPEEIATRAGGEIPFLRLPERSLLFGEREMRLLQLASGHAMRDYLLFVAAVARAQAAAMQDDALEIAVPDADHLRRCASDGRPPLDPATWSRPASWQASLQRMLDALALDLADGPARDAVRRLAAADAASIEQQAERLLAGVMLGLDLATAPLVAAGLQVWYARVVAKTEADARAGRLAPFGRIDDATRCPCCGGRPTASVTRIGAAEAGYRYLHCSLCASQWHMVRIKCARCLSTKGIAYRSLAALADADADAGDARKVQGRAAAARAVELECCEACGHYLKIVHMERDPNVEPTADDLASLTLDLLAAEAGLERHGLDYMLVFGDAEAAAAPG